MDFATAVEYKRKNSLDTYSEKGMDMKVFVVPKHDKDFFRYLDTARTEWRNLKDDYALPFSSNGQFDLCGLWFDGANILYKVIQING